MNPLINKHIAACLILIVGICLPVLLYPDYDWSKIFTPTPFLVIPIMYFLFLLGLVLHVYGIKGKDITSDDFDTRVQEKINYAREKFQPIANVLAGLFLLFTLCLFVYLKYLIKS